MHDDILNETLFSSLGQAFEAVASSAHDYNADWPTLPRLRDPNCASGRAQTRRIADNYNRRQ